MGGRLRLANCPSTFNSILQFRPKCLFCVEEWFAANASNCCVMLMHSSVSSRDSNRFAGAHNFA
jgi:hypothetical protein